MFISLLIFLAIIYLAMFTVTGLRIIREGTCVAKRDWLDWGIFLGIIFVLWYVYWICEEVAEWKGTK